VPSVVRERVLSDLRLPLEWCFQGMLASSRGRASSPQGGSDLVLRVPALAHQIMRHERVHTQHEQASSLLLAEGGLPVAHSDELIVSGAGVVHQSHVCSRASVMGRRLIVSCCDCARYY
jgi:hypothetical protein